MKFCKTGWNLIEQWIPKSCSDFGTESICGGRAWAEGRLDGATAIAASLTPRFFLKLTLEISLSSRRCLGGLHPPLLASSMLHIGPVGDRNELLVFAPKLEGCSDSPNRVIWAAGLADLPGSQCDAQLS